MNQQTIDRVKAGLHCCSRADPFDATCKTCPYDSECKEGYDKRDEVPGTHLMDDAKKLIEELEMKTKDQLVWHKREEAESMKLKNFGRYLCRCAFKHDEFPFDPDDERYAYYCCMDWLLFRYVRNEETGQDEERWEPHFADEGCHGLVVTHFADFSRPGVYQVKEGSS